MECQLNQKNLADIAKSVSVPRYDRTSLTPGLVHMGMGHFHRAHYLVYLHRLLNRGTCREGVFEVDIMPVKESFRSHLEAQDHLYSLMTKAADGSTALEVIGPILGYANAMDSPSVVLDRLASPHTSLISLTITEKGYCYHDQEHSIDWTHPGIIHDLAVDDVQVPVTAIGYLARSLNMRFLDGKLPVTIMSCDNVPENGKVLKRCILQFCQKKYPLIEEWIASSIAFPCTVVDRITPATTEDTIRAIRRDYGLIDECAVHCEDYLQWFIEGSSVTPIPDFASVGATMVADVKPYSVMKIRLLNGSHSALSYPAYLLGLRDVDKAMDNPLIRTFIRDHYMEEVVRTLPPIDGIELSAYMDILINRFSNPYIRDTILRLASDGSKKISNAIIIPLMEAIQAGLNYKAMVFSLACWARFLIGMDEQGAPIPLEDTQAEHLQILAVRAKDEPRRFLEAINLGSLTVHQWQEVEQLFQGYLATIVEQGIHTALKKFLEA